MKIFGGKKIPNIPKAKIFLIGQINGSKLCFVLCQLLSWSEQNLIDSCESSWNEDAKIGIGFVSSSNTSRENQQNDFPKKHWIH